MQLPAGAVYVAVTATGPLQASIAPAVAVQAETDAVSKHVSVRDPGGMVITGAVLSITLMVLLQVLTQPLPSVIDRVNVNGELQLAPDLTVTVCVDPPDVILPFPVKLHAYLLIPEGAVKKLTEEVQAGSSVPVILQTGKGKTFTVMQTVSLSQPAAVVEDTQY